MSDKKHSGFGGTGYYIALILCAAAIGVSGFLYYRNADKEPTQIQHSPSAPVSGEENVAAIATRPTTDATVPRETQKPTEAAKQPIKTAAPLSGETVAEYAMDCLSYNATTRDWRVHDGVDIAAEAGTSVTAAADGTVYTVYNDDTMGSTVIIRHAGGYVTTYSSLSQEVSVSPGDTVKLGQTIGSVGTTALLESALGDHVHFSVTCDGEAVDPQEFWSLG